jgi:hypothetical protein
MNITALWGFHGDAEKLGVPAGKVVAGDSFENVDDEYAHQLLGKGLAEETGKSAAPKSSKQAAPKENK